MISQAHADNMRRIANLPPESVTDPDITAVIDALSADTRVASVSYAGRSLQGRHALTIQAVDFAGGDMSGTFTLGRVLHAAETQDGRAERLARIERERVAADARLMQDQAEYNAWRCANLDRLKAAGIRPQTLSWYVNAITRGAYVAPDDPAHDAYAWYESEIVRGGERPLDLARYLHVFAR